MLKRRTLPSSSAGNNEEKFDRISMLPEALIHHILSFIDTIYAVQACVLSKRWINVWKSLPFLNFDIRVYKSASRQSSDFCSGFIDRVFMLRDGCNIQWLRLRWHHASITNVIKNSFCTWIDASVGRNVQEVTISLIQHSYKFTYEIPPSLLNCKSLKRLTLSVRHYAYITFPVPMSLPQLKFMCLEGFSVTNVESTERLFSSCPLLETLRIVDCDIQTDDRRNFTIESLSLKQFAYTHHQSNQKRHHLMPKIIDLSAPNLTSFTCESYLTQEYNLQNCSDQLFHANLSVLSNNQFVKKKFPIEEKTVYAKRLAKLLIAVDKVKGLDLSSEFLEVLWRVSDSFNGQLPWLCNLHSLRLATPFTRGSLRAIVYLLSICPYIKTLVLTNQQNLKDVGVDNWEVSVPDMLSHLNVVRIENAKGCDAEVKILSFLLKQAKCLEEVALYPCSSVDSCTMIKQLKKELRALPRASSRIKMRWGTTESTLI